MSLRRALVALALLAGPAWIAGPAAAVEFIVTSGKLSDDDFYNLVACAAVPGGPCAEQIVRWPRAATQDLTVAVAPVPGDYPKQLSKVMVEALDRAIIELNASGANLHLRRISWADGPLIRLFLTPAGDGEEIRGTGSDSVDGQIIGAGLTTIWWNDRRQITRGIIAMASDLPEPEVYPVILEELTQSMGLLTDIRNPFYDLRSVFSEDSNSVTRLGPQDLMALRRHYP